MKSLILAAGYATRLYPLTKNFPKPLLMVGAFSILDRLIADLDKIDSITEHIIVTNDSFITHFDKWKANCQYSKPIVLVNDGTDSNDTRLGAVRDILLVIERYKIREDLLVLAGDNVVDFSFAPFIEYALQKAHSCITCHYEASVPALQKTGVLETDESFRVIAMHEKPENPPSHYAVPPFYFYRATDLPLISTALEHGCGFDAPGNLIAWLCKQTDVYAFELKGHRYDIGDLSAYNEVCSLFNLTTKNSL